MALTKAEMAERLFLDVGLNKREAKEFVDAFFESVRDALERGEQVKLSGFGNFDLRLKNERPGRNPKTGEEIPISARRVVTFRPGQKAEGPSRSLCWIRGAIANYRQYPQSAISPSAKSASFVASSRMFLRYWEQEFPNLKPVKRRGNRRYYQRHDVLMIRQIRSLLYDQGFTITGARQRLEGPAGAHGSQHVRQIVRAGAAWSSRKSCRFSAADPFPGREAFPQLPEIFETARVHEHAPGLLQSAPLATSDPSSFGA